LSAQADLSELNRRIAIEVMGEPEPTIPTRSKPSEYSESQVTNYLADSTAGWYIWLRSRRMRGEDEYEWVPLRFSEDMDLAMRAVDKVLEENDSLVSLGLGYTPGIEYSPWAAILLDAAVSDAEQVEAYGDSAPEAICRCLLAYAEGRA
jgi:hypothetical protein